MPPIRSDQLRLLEKLCNAAAVSGDEREVREIVVAELKGNVDDLSVDALGNVLARRGGRGRRRPRVMLTAHMDEVGLMIVAADERGAYRFEIVGSMDPRYLPGKHVIVGRQRWPGVVSGVPPRSSPDDCTREHRASTFRIDLGQGARTEIGERATFGTRFRKTGACVMGKALDDRIGVATVLELLRNPPTGIDLYAAFTVQQEVGARGAQVAAQAVAPDIAIVVECARAADVPPSFASEDVAYNTRLGLGPALYVSDARTVYDVRLVDLFRKTAIRHGIPCQVGQPAHRGTDGAGVGRAPFGVPCVAVAVPLRYAHTPLGLARLDDWANTIDLITHVLRGVSSRLVSSMRGRVSR